jgi:hypothetical protein
MTWIDDVIDRLWWIAELLERFPPMPRLRRGKPIKRKIR